MSTDWIDTSKIVFAFGPGQSYLFHGPRGSSRRGLHKHWDHFDFDGIASISCAALSHDHHDFFTYKETKGTLQCYRISKFTTRFKDTWDWICARYKWDCHVAFGPADSRVAWDKNGHEGWGFTGHAEVWDRLCGLFAAGAPRHLSLGAGWAFFFLRPDGRWSLSDPEGCYPTLRAQLDALAVRQGDIEFLALNPFHVDEFFLLLRSNTAVFRVAHGCRADVGDLLAKHGITCGPDDPPPAYDDHAPPPS